ncbi:hypothetical protein ACEQ8H_003680 [Pleosporales sp. CAS-2024a]
MATKTKYVDREIPQISLHDFEHRIDVISTQICTAAETVGFFAVKDHGLSEEEVQSMFSVSESFFNLADSVKASVPWTRQNFGQNMTETWISEHHLPEFKAKSLEFMHRVQAISEQLMLCLARGLGFDDDYFIKYHDISRPDSQSTLRLLHYYETPKTNDGILRHRAGAHADWGFLTLLFQRCGQSGLEICPGREAVTEHGLGDEWTKVDFEPGVIVCNIGDLLMSWSDDRFKSTYHRVKAPCEQGDYYGERYSIAYFNQPVKDAVIQGPLRKYPVVTGEEFNRAAMAKYYGGALQEKDWRQRGQR